MRERERRRNSAIDSFVNRKIPLFAVRPILHSIAALNRPTPLRREALANSGDRGRKLSAPLPFAAILQPIFDLRGGLYRRQALPEKFRIDAIKEEAGIDFSAPWSWPASSSSTRTAAARECDCPIVNGQINKIIRAQSCTCEHAYAFNGRFKSLNAAFAETSQ